MSAASKPARAIAVCALPRLASALLARGRPGHVPYEGGEAIVMLPRDVTGALPPPRPPHRLLDACDVARARGARPGQRVHEAQRGARDLRCAVVADDDVHAELVAVAERLLALSPLVEVLPPRLEVATPMAAIAVDVTGLPRARERLLSDLARACAQAGHPAAVALSSSRALSLALATATAIAAGGREPAGPALQRWSSLVDIERLGRARARARLPVSALSLDHDTTATLHAAGVFTLDDLGRLSDHGLSGRLDTAPIVLRLLRLTRATAQDDDDASDEGDGLVSPLVPEEIVGASRDLEHGVFTVEPLLFVLRPLVQSVLGRLAARGLRLAELTVALGVRRRPPLALDLPLSSPTLAEEPVVRLARARLERAFDDGEVHGVDDDGLHKDGVTRVMLLARRTVARTATQQALGGERDAPAQLALRALVSELKAGLPRGASVGHPTVTDARLPEELTALSLSPPVPPPEVHGPPRRRRPRPVVTDARTAGGRFLAGWPWPTRLLPQPAALPFAADDIERDALFAVLEGEDARGPYRRHYRVLTLRDGRRALALRDDDAGVTWLQGWFD